MQCKQTWIFFRFPSVQNIFYVFSTEPVLFSPELYKLKCALLCDSSLLIMSAKDDKSDVFSYSNIAKGEFLARSHTISSKCF